MFVHCCVYRRVAHVMECFVIGLSLFIIGSVSGLCAKNRFGPSCNFQCHCRDNNYCSDKTGECTYGGCEAGYFGPSCQYENIAYKKTAKRKESSYPELAVDGSENTCSYSSRRKAQFWKVDIGHRTWIDTITIRKGRDGTKNLKIYVSNSTEPTGDDFVLCNDTSGWSDDVTFHTRCSSAILGQHVFVLGDVNKATLLYLCEVYVSGGRNIALDKTASQSSTYDSYYASLAVDGNTDTEFSQISCTHTNYSRCSNGGQGTQKPKWTVNLGKDYLINRIVVYNREGYNSRRLSKCRILGAKTGESLTGLYREDRDNPPELIPVVLTTPSLINRVMIKLFGECKILTLCEVQVYGDCLDGHYGLDCNNTCQCEDKSEVCGKLDGRCLSGCPAGKTGISCNTDCTAGKFGKNCADRCNVTCKYQTCHVRTGKCNSGCIAGYQGEFCEKDCDDLHFGDNCSRRCSKNCNDGICNKYNGRCIQGCLPGWLSFNCTQACIRGYFGRGCRQVCSSTCVNSSCRNTDGVCINGCLPGWRGSHCSEYCSNGTYGASCSIQCGTTCKHNECNRFNGSCTQGCLPGWHGEFCLKACPDTTYGQGCISTCHDNCVDNLCHTQTGACLRCTDGWEGPMCQTESKGMDMTAVIVSVILSVIVLAALAGLVVFFMHKRKKNKQKQVCSLQDQCMYENIAATEAVEEADTRSLTQDTDNEVDPCQNVDITIDTIDDDEAVLVADVEADTCEPRSVKAGVVQHVDDDNVYYNAPALEVNTAIALTTLTSLMGWWREDEHYFLQEFKRLPRDLQFPYTVAQSDGNKGKNRYKNICAYDHSRVILSKRPDDANSDYINACFIDGYHKEKTFIAAQGPTHYIVNDFVRMIWEMNTTVIVLLANIMEEGKKKFDQYWPDEDVAMYGDISVTVINEMVLADYIIRTLQVSKDNTTPRCVEVFHYTSWPDKDVPDSPVALLHFRDRVKQETTTAPILVHCSAGIGRTGTFIALDYLLDEASSTEQIDVYQCIFKLRQQRVNMVQTLNQYTFIHEAVAMTMMLQKPTISVKFNLEEILNNTEKEYEALDSLSFSYDHEFMDGMSKENSSKNRDESVLPSNRHRPKLWIPVEGCNNYINAVYVKSYTDRKGYVQTQSPLPNTTVDFWRLVVEDSIAVIICLDTYKDETQDAPVYWPRLQNSRECGPFSIKCTSEEKQGVITERKLVVDNKKHHVDIQHFSYKGWHKDSSVPASISQFVAFIQKVQASKHKPILVHCRSGYIHSGLFCAVSNMLDHLKHEHEVASGHVVLQIRESRFQNVCSLEQYVFCYRCASEQIDNEPVYSNI